MSGAEERFGYDKHDQVIITNKGEGPPLWTEEKPAQAADRAKRKPKVTVHVHKD